MADYQHKPGTFSLFKNDKKGNEKAPDFKGTGKDESGELLDFAAWRRMGKAGEYFSCTFKKKDLTKGFGVGNMQAEVKQNHSSDPNDDIPF